MDLGYDKLKEFLKLLDKKVRKEGKEKEVALSESGNEVFKKVN